MRTDLDSKIFIRLYSQLQGMGNSSQEFLKYFPRSQLSGIPSPSARRGEKSKGSSVLLIFHHTPAEKQIAQLIFVLFI